MNYLSIGEMSKLSNVSIQTLRYYDQLELFTPAFIDPQSNYRYYSVDQLFYLDIIKYLRHLELPLKEIKELLKLPAQELSSALQEQSRLIDTKIAHLYELKQALNYQQFQLKTQDFLQSRPFGEVYQRILPKRTLLTITPTTNLTPLDTPDKAVRSLTKQLEKNQAVAPLQYSFCFPLKTYTSLEKIVYSKLLMPLYREIEITDSFEIVKVKSTKMLCIAFNWSTVDYLKHYQKLLDAYQTNYKKSDVEVEEISFPLTYTKAPNNKFVTELRIPLKD
ncbi:MerR family transcriptional regulator [Ligilactobacillus faecis]|uniref:MerR family transcriptional regulator n=1 Tax=Ligilactobacillus faecis TaxID=762833 RepID=UPI00246822F5|nr:helix-turn-helix domain-containing protein [Ligilactobacillus faecis]WGN90471.1 helix-turn-helix domain-containing protein [Ligilactobacillus faecis]